MKTTDKALIEKLKEYVKVLELHTKRHDLDNPTHVKLRTEIASLEVQDKEPSDQDIKRASEEYLYEQPYFDNEDDDVLHAYQQGAKDTRDGKIYVSP